MPVNLNQPQLWKADIAQSVDMYNDWFMTFAPSAYRETRIKTTKAVEETLIKTNNLTDVKVKLLREHPGVLPTLRMSTCPPIAVDRLVGLAGVSKNLVGCMEKGELPPQMASAALQIDLEKIGTIIEKMADPDIFVWLQPLRPATDTEMHRAATIVADRLCGAVANPIIRNAQEKRQLAAIGAWLLIPSEFMDVNYGVPVKRYLLNQVELIRIHRFDPSELQFGDALVSSAVVWFRKRKPAAGHQVEFSYGGTLARPKITRTVPLSTLQGAAKWTSLAADGVRAITDGLRLADFFDIKRGLATGDNSFFILSREQIAAHDLPMEFLKPILPSARHLETDIIETDPDGSPKLTRQLFMLDCRLPEAEVKAR